MVKTELRIGGPIFYRNLEKVVKNKELTKAQKRAIMVEELLRKVDQI
ncbi:MAG: hypothetical protein Q8N87_03045 [bacterium]|nr:hypothetical protein [bacterium]